MDEIFIIISNDMTFCITSDNYMFKPIYKNSYEISNILFKNYNDKLNNLLYIYHDIIKYIAIIIIKKKINFDIGLHIMKYHVIKRFDFYEILYNNISKLVFNMIK